MTELQKLIGGRKPFFINSADGAITTKKFFLLLPTENTTFTAIDSGVAPSVVNEQTAMNIGAKSIGAGTPINCDGEAYFTKVHVATGMVAAYEALT